MPSWFLWDENDYSVAPTTNQVLLIVRYQLRRARRERRKLLHALLAAEVHRGRLPAALLEPRLRCQHQGDLQPLSSAEKTTTTKNTETGTDRLAPRMAGRACCFSKERPCPLRTRQPRTPILHLFIVLLVQGEILVTCFRPRFASGRFCCPQRLSCRGYTACQPKHLVSLSEQATAPSSKSFASRITTHRAPRQLPPS